MEQTNQAAPAESAPTVEQRLAAHFAPEQPEQPEQRRRAEPAETVEAQEFDDVGDAEDGGETSEVARTEAPDGDSTEADGEEEVIELSSISDLMEHFDLAPEDLYNLTVPVSINGKRQDVSLSEWKDSYVAAQEASKFREEAKAVREQIEAQRAETEQKYQQQLAQGVALVQALEKEALSRFEGINWNELRASDPSEWSAQMAELNNAKARLDAAKREVQTRLESFQSEQKAQHEHTLQEHLSKEREALVAAWPEMGNESKAAAERTALIDELKNRGFTDQEIGQAADHRILLLARDAMRWRQSMKKADVAKKKVLKIGKKVIQPGARQSRAEQQQDSIRPLRQRLRKSGDMNDAAALISRMRNK